MDSLATPGMMQTTWLMSRLILPTPPWGFCPWRPIRWETTVRPRMSRGRRGTLSTTDTSSTTHGTMSSPTSSSVTPKVPAFEHLGLGAILYWVPLIQQLESSYGPVSILKSPHALQNTKKMQESSTLFKTKKPSKLYEKCYLNWRVGE